VFEKHVTEMLTPAGTNVQVDFFQGTTATFDNVTIEGITTIVHSSEPPEGIPTSAAFEYNGKYFDVSTTAGFSGNVELCFTYNDGGLSLTEEENLKLLHFNEATVLWEESTSAPIDTVNNIICGTTTHFSVFAVGLPYDSDNDLICDQDIDVVGVCDAGPDNCRSIPNNDQSDFDGDGVGDDCDDDVDGDNVADTGDSCLFTPLGTVVDSLGCSIAQLVPCEGPAGTTTEWRNHGKFVSAMSHTLNSFLKSGLISEDERDSLMSQAAGEDCGSQ
jgi:hypothetical protein